MTGPMTYRCPSCGSDKVQMLEWIDPNTEEIMGGACEGCSPEIFCENCEDEPSRFVMPGEVYEGNEPETQGEEDNGRQMLLPAVV